MNRERRKVIGNIFADAAKYTLTAGVIGSLISGEIPGFVFVATGCASPPLLYQLIT